MTLLAITSDLHLEFGDINLKNEEGAEVLVIAGDLFIAQDLHDHPEPVYPLHIADRIDLGRRQKLAYRYRDFLKRVSFQFPHVVVIAGNHEFYQGKWIGSIVHLRHEYSKFPNIHFLERDMKTIYDVTFVGGTLWTDCNKCDPLTLHSLPDMMNDFNVIRRDDLGYTKLRPAHIVERHRQTLDYFRSVIDNSKDQKIVVVSHHAPSDLSVPEYYKDRFLMNGGYRSDLSDFIMDRPQIKYWLHGHTHDEVDYMLGSTRIVCNPRGYHGYEPSADKFQLKYLEV